MRTYAIKLEGSTQQKRQKLYDFLISKNEPIYPTTNLIKKHYDYRYFIYTDSDIWAGAGDDNGLTPISIIDFITKFQEPNLNIREYCIDCTDSTHTERMQIIKYLKSISETVHPTTTFMDDDERFQKGAIFGYYSSGRWMTGVDETDHILTTKEFIDKFINTGDAMSTINVDDIYLNSAGKTCTIISPPTKDSPTKVSYKHQDGKIYTTGIANITKNWTKQAAFISKARGNYKVGDKVGIRADLPTGVKYGMNRDAKSTYFTEDMTQAYYNTDKKWLYSGHHSNPDISISSDLFIATRGRGSYAIGDHVIDDTISPVMRGTIIKIGDRGQITVAKSTPGESIYNYDGTYYPQDTAPRLKVVDPKDQPTVTANKPLSSHKLRPFNRDSSLNVRGMFHQLVKYPSITEARPFILAELAREKQAIHIAVSRITITPSYWLYDIKMAHISASIRAIGILESADDITPQQALDYYTYCSMIGTSTDYSWLAPYLTHANVTSSKPVVLFHSKHRHIELANGYISYTEQGTTYTVPVQYNRDSNSFYF